jgi:hypothetical protein
MYARPGNAGVGRALLAHLEAQATTLGYRALWLETRAVNLGAVRFYAAHGYAPVPNYESTLQSSCGVPAKQLAYLFDPGLLGMSNPRGDEIANLLKPTPSSISKIRNTCAPFNPLASNYPPTRIILIRTASIPRRCARNDETRYFCRADGWV